MLDNVYFLKYLSKSGFWSYEIDKIQGAEHHMATSQLLIVCRFQADRGNVSSLSDNRE